MSQKLYYGHNGTIRTSHLHSDPKFQLPVDMVQLHDTSEGWLRSAIEQIGVVSENGK